MTGTSHPTNQASGRIIPDEASLERLFRSQYTILVGEAKTKLGEEAEAAAPRVVSKAFHQAWNDRAQFRSEDELKAFLHAAIQHGSARELSRRASLHRVDHAVSGSNHPHGAHTEGTHHDASDMSVEEAWTRLQHTLHGTVPEAQRARASTARHEAAEHMAQLAKKRNWWPLIAGGAAVAIGLIGIFWYFDKQGEPRRIARELAATDARKYDTGASQMVNVTLDDQTVVRLAPQTRLIVPRMFGPNLRAVKVEGAAHFNVTQATDKPFQVHAGDVVMIATGTVFTVRRYPEDSAVVLDVREGTVELRRGEDVRTVPQGTAVRVKDGGTIEAPSVAQLQEASGWISDTVTISERTLRYVLPQLKRFYGLDIKVPDTKLLDRQVFLRAAITSPREAITSVEQSAGVKFTYVGETMTFQDTAIFNRRR